MKTVFRFLALASIVTAPVAAAPPAVYRAARMWPGDGPAITNAVLVIQDGKIVSAGKQADVRIPADAVIHDLGDAIIIPGLVVAETTLADKGRDDLHALTPHYRAVDGFDPYADYSHILAGGVTTVQLSPGGKRLMPGQGSVVKLHGDDLVRRLLREEESLRVMLGDAYKNPPRIYEPPVGAVSVDRPLEPTRPQLAGGLSGAIAGLRATFQAGRTAKDNSGNRDSILQAVASAGTPRKPVRVTAPAAADVQAALNLAREFDLRLLFVDPPAPTSEQITAWKSCVDGVILNPGVRPGSMVETTEESATPAGRSRRLRGLTPAAQRANAPRSASDDTVAGSPAEVARDLRLAGMRVAIKPHSDGDLKEMLYVGGLFTMHSNAVEVLKMLTADAATMLNVNDRVGSLAAGKDADFVVLSGDPFALHTRVKTVYIDGQPAYETPTGHAAKVIRGARVWTGSGEVIPGGAVLVEGRTIRAVGRDVSTPADAEEKRFAGAVIVPGMIDLANGIGVGGAINAPISINTKLGARLVSGDSAAQSIRQAGVTTVLLSAPAPSPVLAFKIGETFRPLKDPVALKFAVRGNLTTTGASLRDQLKAAKAYADGWTKYEGELTAYEKKKKEYDAAKAKEPEKKPDEKKDDKKADDKKEEKKPEEKKLEEPKPPTKPQSVESLEPFRALFAGKIPALVEAKREDAIRLALTIFRDECNLRTILVGADDAFRLAELLTEKSVAVSAGPDLVRTVDRADVNLPLSLAVRGIPFGFQSQASAGAKHLPLAVGFAVRHGLGSDEALRGLTSTPANFLGLETVGTIAVGKDADLVVLSGQPFELSTRVLAVMIDGQWVYQE